MEAIQEFVNYVKKFKDVWFAYNSDNYVLKDISFKIGVGESIAFVGSTGSGKTSIINLLNRFYEFQKGKILIDGNDIKKLNSSDLRDNLGLVSQDVFLFSDTIFNNITLFNDNIRESQVWDSIDQFVCRKLLTNCYARCLTLS